MYKSKLLAAPYALFLQVLEWKYAFAMSSPYLTTMPIATQAAFSLHQLTKQTTSN